MTTFNWAQWVTQEYDTYNIKTGSKVRIIEAPRPELKKLQRLLLDTLLYKLEPTEYAHGFLPGRSTVTNAQPHVGCDWVVTADIKDFFPSITTAQVLDALKPLGLSAQRLDIIVALVTRDGRLPQGTPTSPHIANLVVRRMDMELSAQKGWTYTRYADDLAFSGGDNPHHLMQEVLLIVRSYGFQLAQHKTRIMPRSQRQIVTGIVVNEKLALPKGTRRKLRAMLHKLKKEPVGGQRGQVIKGHVAHAQSVEAGNDQHDLS